MELSYRVVPNGPGGPAPRAGRFRLSQSIAGFRRGRTRSAAPRPRPVLANNPRRIDGRGRYVRSSLSRLRFHRRRQRYFADPQTRANDWGPTSGIAYSVISALSLLKTCAFTGGGSWSAPLPELGSFQGRIFGAASKTPNSCFVTSQWFRRIILDPDLIWRHLPTQEGKLIWLVANRSCQNRTPGLTLRTE